MPLPLFYFYLESRSYQASEAWINSVAHTGLELMIFLIPAPKKPITSSLGFDLKKKKN